MLDNIVLIIAPVGTRCNLSCSYCYQQFNAKGSSGYYNLNISLKILRCIWQDASQIANHIATLWHGGEPLLYGFKKFKKALQLQDEVLSDIPHQNIIQTNATLITKTWASFLSVRNIITGVSIDGPKIAHNNARIFKKTRKGSFEKSLNGYQALVKAGANSGVAVLLHRGNINLDPLDFFQFLASLNPDRISLHPVIPFSLLGANLENLLRFYILFFKYWNLDNQPFKIKAYDDIARLSNGLPSQSCQWGQKRCHKFIAISPQGDVYPCMRLYGYTEWHIGNIHEYSLKDIRESQVARKVYQTLTSIPDNCRGCCWIQICGGGCPAERWVETKTTNTKHPYCSFYQCLFHLIQNEI